MKIPRQHDITSITNCNWPGRDLLSSPLVSPSSALAAWLGLDCSSLDLAAARLAAFSLICAHLSRLGASSRSESTDWVDSCAFGTSGTIAAMERAGESLRDTSVSSGMNAGT